MTHVVTEKCVDCRFTDCVEACPVACFYLLDRQLVIDPEDCIDCTACVPECPVEAIYMEEDVPEEFRAAIAFNAAEAARLKGAGAQGMTTKIEALPTAEARKAELGY